MPAERRFPIRLVVAVCTAEVLTMLGVFAFPALLPTFFDQWQLTNTQAGWISGIYFAAYAAAVPVLSSLTDRIDARIVYLLGAAVAAVAAIGFALFAVGFWSALVLRALAGVGLAGTYMPGVRILVDRYGGPAQSRMIALYTASFSLGTALSFLVAGQVEQVLGWQGAFAVAAAAAAAAMALVATLRPISPEQPARRGILLDPRPVLRNRPAMGYVLAYGAHSWELFAMRSWLVAFLVFSLSLQPARGFSLAPTTVATLSGLVAMAASIGGAELARLVGLRRLIGVVMLASAAMAMGIGFLAAVPYVVLVALVLVYSIAVQMDSAALTIGATTSAEPGRRGATLAMHSLVGFGCAGLGPLVVGIVLDLTDATRIWSWGLAFASMGIVAALGPVALWTLGGRGDATR